MIEKQSRMYYESLYDQNQENREGVREGTGLRSDYGKIRNGNGKLSSKEPQQNKDYIDKKLQNKILKQKK